MNQYQVDCDGVHLSVRDWAGGEPVILALHGLASNARWWDLVAQRLTPRYRVISVDQRGHGLSDKPDAGYDVVTVANDLRNLHTQLHLGKVIVAGHSWGASVALQFAVAHPELVGGVVCVDGGAASLADYFGPSWETAEEAMRPPQFSGLTPDTVKAWVQESPLVQGSDLETAAEILLGNFVSDAAGELTPALTLDRHMQIAKDLFHLDSFALMSQLKCPALLIPADSGDESVAARHRAVERAQAVLGPRAHVTWIAGGHDLPVQRPTEVAAAIAEFAPLVMRDAATYPSKTS